MFMVLATPEFYKVSNDGPKRTFEHVSAGDEDNSESGLIILTHDGRHVQPVLKRDQVTLMVGAGFKHWVDTSEQLTAVMHALRKPKVVTMDTEGLLRAWFGKTTLLPSNSDSQSPIRYAPHFLPPRQFGLARSTVMRELRLR